MIVALALGAFGAGVARAHQPPPVYLLVEIGAESVRVRLAANVEVFEDWFGLGREAVPADPAAVSDAVREQVRATLAGFLRVAIDRVPVEGVLAALAPETYVDHEIEWSYINTTLAYGTKGRPREVSFVWTRYGGPLGALIDQVQGEISGVGKTIYPVFREREPEFVWHAPREAPPPPPMVLPPAPAPRRLPIPWLSVAILLGTAGGFVAAGRRGLAARPRLVGVAVGLALAVSLSGVAKTEVTLPGRAGFERPPDDQTLYLFEALLRNVYRAFDYDTENAVYDTLARSVTGALLDSVYLEVHTSLVMQDQGGAVCKVESVEVLAKEVLPSSDPDAPVLRVRTRWSVQGRIGHWGHTHQRVNEYEADFTLVEEPDGWKIAALDVRRQVRVDDGGTAR